MIDVTGCHWVVTAVDATRFDVGHDLYTGNEFRVERGYGPVTVEWAGGESPRDVLSSPAEIGGLLPSTRKFLAVPVPETTAEHLAAAVLMKNPCGRELVDCLIEADTLDIDGEFAAKVKAETMAKVDAVLRKFHYDYTFGDLRFQPIHVGKAELIEDIMKAVSELA